MKLLTLEIEAKSSESDQNGNTKRVSKMNEIKPGFHLIWIANLSISHYLIGFSFSWELYELAPKQYK